MSLQDEWLNSYGPMMFAEQPRRSCSTMAINQSLMEFHPAFRRLLSELERETSARLAAPVAFAVPELVTIPVVVHVLWHDPQQDISDAQVASQITVLNADYAASNLDRVQIPAVWAGLSMDSGIRFALANRDPNGNPHSGITRTQVAVPTFAADDSMKSAILGGVDAWPADRYLNVWVCNLKSILGYAQFPGGPPATDGVVIGYRCFGTNGTAVFPFDGGRTTTHEVGHWLNLRHIWGDTEDCSGSDFVSDTPPQRLPNYDVPNFPTLSCTNGPNGDMFMNYMDYVDDRAMVMFTSGQVARMRAALETIRVGLVASNGIV
jgi:hypothetical protein